MDKRTVAAVVGLAGYLVVSRVVLHNMMYHAKIRAIGREKNLQIDAIDAASAIVRGKIAKGDYAGRTEMDIHRDKLFYIQMIREGL